MIIPIFFLLTLCCSDDPCENIPCVNGSCNDGICECESGWTGDLCDELDFDFIGDYTLQKIQGSDCSDMQIRLPAEAVDDEFCEGNHCTTIYLTVEADGTFRMVFVDIEYTNNIRIAEPDVVEGEYDIQNDQITLCSTSWVSCAEMKISATKLGLDWAILDTDITGCTLNLLF